MPTLGVDKPEAFPIRDLPTVELPSKDQTAILQALTNLSVAGSAEHLRNAYIQQKQSRQDIYGNVLNRRPVPRRFSWQDEVRFMESGK